MSGPELRKPNGEEVAGCKEAEGLSAAPNQQSELVSQQQYPKAALVAGTLH